MSAQRSFQLISEEDAPEPTAPAAPDQSALTKVNTQMLVLALRALSQRTITAISAAFTLILVGSVWLLCARILADPTVLQLIAIGGYAAFCVIIDIVRRKKA
jgi:hypothetical protein